MMRSIPFRGRSTGVALALVATLAVAGCDSPEERAQKHFDRAMQLVAEGVDDKAAVEFRNALRMKRDFADAAYNLGLLQERRGNLRGAAGSFRAAVDADPTLGGAQLKLGQALMVAGDIDGARPHITEAARLMPENPEARASNAVLLMRAGDAEAAEAEIEAALATDPDNVAAHMARISLAAERGDPDEALALLEARLAVQPAELSYNLVKLRLLEQRGDAAALGAHLMSLTETFPDQLSFRQALSQWRLRTGDVAGAEADLRFLADREGIEGVMRLVSFLAATQSLEAGRAELDSRIAAATEPAASAELRQAAAELDLQAGRVEDGKSTLRALIADAPTPEIANAAKVRLAHAEFTGGDRAAASALVEEVLAGDAENGDALALRAAFAIDDLRPADAIADLRVALRGDPENARYMVLQATAHEREGDVAAAGERLAAATRTSGFEPEFALRYAAFLRGRGEITAAEAALNESARRHPTSREVVGRLAEVRLLLGDHTGAEQAASALRGLAGGAEAADRISAASLAAQGRIDESIRLLERNADREGAGPGVLSQLVASHVRSGEPARAAALLDEMLADEPENQTALLLRAELHIVNGERGQAEELLARLRASAPDSVVGYLATARYAFAMGDLEATGRFIEEGLAISPDSTDLTLLRAQVRERQGDFGGAIADYRLIYESNRDSVVVANNLASLIAEHQADDPEALAFAERVAQRLRGYDAPELKDTYGWILFLRGDAANALPYLRDAAAALPGNAIIRYHVGRAYAALGQDALARENLEAALNLGETFPKAASAREALAALPAAQ